MSWRTDLIVDVGWSSEVMTASLKRVLCLRAAEPSAGSQDRVGAQQVAVEGVRLSGGPQGTLLSLHWYQD